MARFRVLAGMHSEKDHNGVPQIYKQGDIVDSKSDLLKMNSIGSPKFEKLDEDDQGPRGPRRSPEARARGEGAHGEAPRGPQPDHSVHAGGPAAAGSRPANDATAPRASGDVAARTARLEGKKLEGMNVEELRKVADEEEVDLKGATTKADIVKAIRSSV